MPDPVSPARGVRAILAAVSGFTTGWQVATGQMLAAPDKMLVIRNTGGRAPEPNIAQDYPTVQIIGRGEKKAGGQEEIYQKMVAARRALLGIPSAPAAYPELSSCIGIGDITDVGYDDSDRPMYTLNLQLIVSYETSGYREAV